MPKAQEANKKKSNAMNPILIVDLFDVWGIDFMGPFQCLLFLKENIFSRFGVPKAIISDGGLVGNQEVKHGLDQSRAKRCLDLNEMEELRNDAYINSKVAKQRMKRWHDQLISNKEFGKDKESYSMIQGSISFLGSSSQGGIAKKLKEGLLEQKEFKSKRKFMAYEILQPQEACCEIRPWLLKPPWLRNDFATHAPLCETPPWHTSAISQPPPPHFAVVKCAKEESNQSQPFICPPPPSEPKLGGTFGYLFEIAMAKTRGAKFSSPSSRLKASRETPVKGSIPEPPRPLVVPPPIEDAPLSPPSRCHETRRPPTTPGQVLAEPKSQSSQPPAIESQITSRMTLEVVIRRPMVTQPPIDGNLDCRARPFHSELCFDTTIFRLQPELRDSFHLLQSINGRHGILGARHIVEALHIPYEPARPEDYRVWTHHSQSDIVHILSRRASTSQYLLTKDLPPSMFFIDALLHHNIFPLQHWEEAAQSRCYSTSLPQIAMLDFGALGMPGAPAGPEHPEIPHPEHPEEPHPIEIPADMRAPAPIVPSTETIPEVAPSASPATQRTLPVIPSISEPPPSFEPRIVISISEYKAYEQIIATQTQHTTILSQIQHHMEQTMHPEEPTTGEAKTSTQSIPSSAAEPSSSHHPPATI
ncbi:hypothetical protein CK203_062859 [Vitis vinifera]|uniref:Integrase catalytic domain-containing protein n=1 Tax=Vitis vinifera TaxID=29760 RepID=A0A438FSL4_VITVI|nr:hypothetical protein CK203_062859 [Vitis vinifera]